LADDSREIALYNSEYVTNLHNLGSVLNILGGGTEMNELAGGVITGLLPCPEQRKQGVTGSFYTLSDGI
jgi:hypothetical protein